MSDIYENEIKIHELLKIRIKKNSLCEGAIGCCLCFSPCKEGCYLSSLHHKETIHKLLEKAGLPASGCANKSLYFEPQKRP